MNVKVISLGCDKNKVDTENMLGYLLDGGKILVADYKDADIVIINTCSFLKDAIKESIDTIMEAAAFGEQLKIIVAGCLPQRYMQEISGTEGLVEVDAFVSNQHYHNINSIIDKVLMGERIVLQNEDNGIIIPSESRIITTPMHYAYLKIAEGCDNYCTYCAIPKIRGKYKSAEIDELVVEAKRLIDNNNTKELILVAQDVTRYGSDKGKLSLLTLLDELTKLNIDKIRLMYCYPELVSKELVDRIDSDDKIARYIDIPMQHIDDVILKLMNRKSREKDLRALLDYIKTKDISVRSTFIVGFPSEEERQFDRLLSFLQEYELDNAGFFAYSREAGTAAYNMRNQIPQRIKQARLKEAVKLQSSIMTKKAEELIGKRVIVTYDGIDYKKQKFFGHSEYNHPEIDKKVYFTSNCAVDIGAKYSILINGRNKLDLVGRAEADL